MKVEARIKDEWSKLQTMPLSQCEKITLPVETVIFLTNVGLPAEPFRYLGKNIHFTATNPKISHFVDKRYLVIGSFGDVDLQFSGLLCLQEYTGAVYYDNTSIVASDIELFGNSADIPLYYMNQNIQSLLLYFIAFRENTKLVSALQLQLEQLIEQKTATCDELRKIVQIINSQKQETLKILKLELDSIDATALDEQAILPGFWLEIYLDFKML